MTDLSKFSNEELQALYQSQADGSPTTVSGVTVAAPRSEAITTNPHEDDLAALSDERLKALHANSRPMGALEDVGRSTVSGLERGVARTFSAPGDILNLLGSAGDYVGGVGLGALQDFSGSNLGAPYHGHDSARMAAEPQRAEDRTNYSHLHGLPDGSDAENVMQRVGGPFHEPQTAPGRYAGAVASVLPGALLGAESLPGALTLATGTGGGSEAAGDLFKGTPYEGAARVVGGLAGGGLVQGVRGMTRSPEQLVKKAAPTMTPPQFDAARKLMNNPDVALTWPEAIAQVGGAPNGLTRMQRVIESTRQGGAKTAPFFAERPDQVRAAVTNFADQVAPPTANPSMIGVDAQKAAQGVTGKLATVRARATAPAYAAADAQHVPASDISDLIATIDGQIGADKTGLLAKGLQPLRDHLMNGGAPITDIGNLDRLRKFYRDRIGLPDIAADALPKEIRGALGSHLDTLDGLMEAHSPAFVAGKGLHAALSKGLVDPIVAGPVGKIADTANVPSQTGALYPASPLEGAPAETATAVRLLGGSDPAVPPALTRQHVVNTLNESTRTLQGGANQWGGANFAKAIAGNPEQRATLQAGVEALPGGVPLRSNLDDMLSVLEATGKREHAGSLTAFNEKDLGDLGKAPALVKNASGILNFDQYGRQISDAVSKMQYKRNVDALSDWLTAGANPDGRSASILSALDPTAKPAPTVLQWLTGRP